MCGIGIKYKKLRINKGLLVLKNVIQIFRSLKVFKTLSIWVKYGLIFLDFGSFAVRFFVLFLWNVPQATCLWLLFLFCFLQSWKTYCSDELLCHFPPVINVYNWHVLYGDATTASRFCWSQGQCGELKIQSNLKDTKVQLMQTNNWLADNYHLSMFSFHFSFF